MYTVMQINDTISVESCGCELTLFTWHMPDDATEGVAEYNSRPSFSLRSHCVHLKMMPIIS